MRKVIKAIPIILAVVLLLVSCNSTKKEVEYPDIRPGMEVLFDAKPDVEKMDLIDPMTSYWNIAYNSKVIADAAYEWREFSSAEELFLSTVETIWPVDISDACGAIFALVPTDPQLVEQQGAIAFLYANYENHVQMFVNWKAYAEALEEFITALAENC